MANSMFFSIGVINRKMYRLLGSVILLTTVSCQTIVPSLTEINISLQDLLSNITAETTNLSCALNPTQVLPSNIQFTLYNRANQPNGIILNNANLNLINYLFRFIIIIHGWLQNGVQPWILEMRDAYLNITDANIVVVDWSNYAGINYGAAVCAVPYVGKIVGDFIYNVISSGDAQAQNTQIVGFSLGAHVGGCAGKEYKSKADGNPIWRITGMDAAGPGFEEFGTDRRLVSTDASCVQALHTSGGTFGYIKPYGTVDFELNYNNVGICGSTQPGCPLFPGIPGVGINPYLMCNHIRSIAYMTESISTKSFIAVKCSNCLAFGLRLCATNPTTILGENFPCNVTGTYYLSTNNNTLFAKGQSGTRP